MKVLFVCVHNSARSQMAEAYLNRLGKGAFQAESAGLEPGTLNPLVVQVMAEDGYDLSQNQVKDVFTFFKEGRAYDLVVTVCDQAVGQRCPIFPSQKLTINWGFPDPSAFTGSHEERLQQTRQVRDIIRQRVEEMVRVFNLPTPQQPA